jgi:hypothetical protein
MDTTYEEARHIRECFISSGGDTGNSTYLLNTIIDTVRYNSGREGEEDYDEPSIGLATASTGIEATLLKLGHTFHSTVNVPCSNLNAEKFFPISARSELAQVIRDTNTFVWDEVSMAHKHLMTGLACLFEDLMQDGIPLV